MPRLLTLFLIFFFFLITVPLGAESEGSSSGNSSSGGSPSPNPRERALTIDPSKYEPDTLPSWVLFGLGKRAEELRKYGEAIVDFRRAVDRRGIYPEAEIELGRIEGLNGDPTIQEQQLEKALDQAGVLAVPEDRYLILYALADLRQRRASPQSGEKAEAALETYRDILSEDPIYKNAEQNGGLEGYYSAFMVPLSTVTFKTSTGPSLNLSLVGLNRVLYLYRHRLGFSLKAHQETARLLLGNKAYMQSVAHSLFALVGIFSTVLEEVKNQQPDYVFKDLNELFLDEKSPVFLGRPTTTVKQASSAGAPNPGWPVRYQPIWDYLRDVKTDETLAVLAQDLDALAEKEKSLAPLTNRRSAKEAAAEVRKWLKVLFPESPWTLNLVREKPRG